MSAIHKTANGPEPDVGRSSAELMLARALLGVAILGAGYLAWGAISNGPLAGCGAGSGCDKVLQSGWAYWLSLPVSIPAELVYLALLGATVLLRKRPSPDDERGLWAAVIALSVVVAGAALWFVGLQIFVIKAFCKFCMAVHTCGFVAALVCLRNVPVATDPDTPMWAAGSGKRGVPRQGIISLVLMGLAGVAALSGGQVLFPKQLNLVKVMPSSGTRTAMAGRPTGSALSAAGSATTEQPGSPNVRLIAPGLLSLYNDRFRINLNGVPMMGSPGASNVLVYLFDYTCPHCRDLHGILEVAQRQAGNRLGIACLPMPMSTNCNPLIPANFHSSSNACDYARLGLAVWLAKPEAQRQFDDWFFTPEKPVSVEQAKEYAAQLVGADKLAAALLDPGLDQQILMDCSLHFANWQATGRPAMPQLIIGEAVSLGPLVNVQHLQVLLNKYLHLDLSVNGPR
jgi:uncharacterized membrane protein